MAKFGYRYREDLPLIAITVVFILWSLVLLYSPLGPFAESSLDSEGVPIKSDAVVAYNPDNLTQVENGSFSNDTESGEDAVLGTSDLGEIGRSDEQDSAADKAEERQQNNGASANDEFDSSTVAENASDAEFGEFDSAGNSENLSAPLLAVIIDDWGYHWPAAEGFLRLDAPMTYAILPYQKYSREHAEKARAAGYEVALHLPMAPQNPDVDPGPGAIYVTQDDAEIKDRVMEALAQVPEAVGANNHMGSGVTENERVMRVVLQTLKEQGKYFIDSHTSGKTVVPKVATEIGIDFGQNEVFIDNQADVEYIKGRICLAAEIAKEKGFAIAIGHVKEATLTALQEMLPKLDEEGIELVTVSELLRKAMQNKRSLR